MTTQSTQTTVITLPCWPVVQLGSGIGQAPTDRHHRCRVPQPLASVPDSVGMGSTRGGSVVERRPRDTDRSPVRAPAGPDPHSEHRFPAPSSKTASTAFRHPPPNSARFSYATEGALFISAQLSSDAVSALRKVRVLI